MSNSKVIYKTKITIQDILVLFLALSFIIGAVINHTQEQELSREYKSKRLKGMIAENRKNR